VAATEEDVRSILAKLYEANWSAFFTRKRSPLLCHRCRGNPPLIDDLCPACAVHLCALCRQPTLKDDYHGYYYRIICSDCLVRRNIDNRWTSREGLRVGSHELRATQLGRQAYLPLREWLTILEDFDWRCAYCQEHPYEDIEHFIPLLEDGDTLPSNCVPSCQHCNQKKGSTHPDRVKTIPRRHLDRVKEYLNPHL
jgi:5-methylcytosine-specific restriction endonuclease McrA